jgi:uncharacterized protein YneF (UPF0154 family)
MRSELIRTLKATAIAIIIVSLVIGGMVGGITYSAKKKQEQALKQQKQIARDAIRQALENSQKETEKLRLIDREKKQKEAKRQEQEFFNANFIVEKDEVRGLRFIMPNPANDPLEREVTGCALYIGDNYDGNPALFLRCVFVGEKLDHFDEVMFRANNHTFTIRNENFRLISHYRNEHRQRVMYYDFPASSEINKDAIRALVNMTSETKFRFYSSIYNQADDITLSEQDLRLLKAAYNKWLTMSIRNR